MEVFDFHTRWHEVQPYLKKRKVAEQLNSIMRGIANSSDGFRRQWDPRSMGPWLLSSTDAWEDEIDKRIIKAGFEDCGLDLNGYHREVCDCCDRAYQVLYNLFKPRRNSYEWYQCFGYCHELAPWLTTLAKQVLPEYDWRVQGGTHHSIALGYRGDTPAMIFDILWFDLYQAKEILEAAGMDAPKAHDS